jgi:gliding motility-associated-like protein
VVQQQVSIDIALPNDTTICENQTFELVPSTNASDLIWQDGSTNPTYLVNQSGTYTVTASRQGCSKSDSIVVQQVSIDIALPNDTTICEGDVLELMVNDNSIERVIWQNNFERNNFEIRESGNYQVTLFKEGCTQLFDIQVNTKSCQICNIVVPNVFSPNQDGINDELPWLSNCPLRSFEVQIIDRWGNVLYKSNDFSTTWDGTFKNKIVENGVYLVNIIYEFEDELKKRSATFSVQIMK